MFGCQGAVLVSPLSIRRVVAASLRQQSTEPQDIGIPDGPLLARDDGCQPLDGSTSLHEVVFGATREKSLYERVGDRVAADQVVGVEQVLQRLSRHFDRAVVIAS